MSTKSVMLLKKKKKKNDFIKTNENILKRIGLLKTLSKQFEKFKKKKTKYIKHFKTSKIVTLSNYTIKRTKMILSRLQQTHTKNKKHSCEKIDL